MTEQARAVRRAAHRKRVHRQRRFAAVAVLAVLVALIAELAGAGGSREESAKHARQVAATTAAKLPPKQPPANGGPLAPASGGGLGALWAPANVVAPQPQTAATYL